MKITNFALKFENVGRMIKSSRVNAGLSAKELAEKVYLTERTIQNYENGSQVPSELVLEKILHVCGVTVNFFCNRSDIKSQAVLS